MKIPRVSRKARRVLALLSIAVMVIGFIAWVNSAISLQVNSSSTNHAATSAVMNSASATAFNGTSFNCPVTGNSASCPNIQLTIGGSTTESGNYTLSVSFTGSPAGASLQVNCTTTGTDSCTPTSQTVIITGTSQTISGILVKPTATGSGTAGVTLQG